MRSLLISYWGFFPPFHAIYTYYMFVMCVWMFVLFLYCSALRIAKERYDAVQMCVHLIGWSVLNHIQRTYSPICILIRWANQKKPTKFIFKVCTWLVVTVYKHTYSRRIMSSDITNKGRIYMLVLFACLLGVNKLSLHNRDRCVDAKQLNKNRLSFTHIDFDCNYCETISTYFKHKCKFYPKSVTFHI